ncbi:uncharacterized protein [Typha latifolia]|uniref:uncharacterized protein n=1 Tax=Typha latifolia TaxID=4733 RepID=UPI003C2E03C3
MALLSATFLYPANIPTSFISLSRNPTLSSLLLLPSSRKQFAISSSASSSTIATDSSRLEITTSIPVSTPNWAQFASRVSGEWDGFGADFTREGNPIELPETVVPEAFREWEVQVFDWQTQCPTLASVTDERPLLSYKLIKLLPTVGCEADAATRHSVEERIAGEEGSAISAFAYDPSGCYVAMWSVDGRGGRRAFELEHCLVDPRNWEVRVRVIQVVGVDDEGVMRLEKIRVFSEQWYGPFRNGEQLGGCAIRESGFAATSPVELSEVGGVWQQTNVLVAKFGTSQNEVLQEFSADRPQKLVRNHVGIVPLPKQLWCFFEESKNGEVLGEVGWLFDHGKMMTSRCILFKDGKVKETAIAYETAVLEDT